MRSREQTKAPDGFAQDRRQLSRRQFCNTLTATSAALAVVATGLASQVEAGQEPAIVYPPRKIEGAEMLMPGSSLYFTYPTSSDPAILVRGQDGQFYAYSQRCTHRGCSVYFDPSQKCLECPCHRGAYHLQSGEVMFGPPQRPLDVINLQMRAGGQLWATGKTVGSRERYARI